MVWHMARFKEDNRTESGTTISWNFNAPNLREADGTRQIIGRVASREPQMPDLVYKYGGED